MFSGKRLLDTRVKSGDADPMVSLVSFLSPSLPSLVRSGPFESSNLGASDDGLTGFWGHYVMAYLEFHYTQGSSREYDLISMC